MARASDIPVTDDTRSNAGARMKFVGIPQSLTPLRF